MPDIKATTDDWISVNSLSGIAVGTQLRVQNKATNFCLLQEAASKPDIANFEGEIITPIYQPEPSKIVLAGSGEVWVRPSFEGEGAVHLYAQEWVTA